MKERTSTINEDPSSHDEHPNQTGLPKLDSNTTMAAVAVNNNGAIIMKPHQRAVLTKNSSFAMRTLTTRLSGFFRKFSTSSSVSGGNGGGPSSGTADPSDGDVCSMCHRFVKRGLNDKTGGALAGSLGIMSGAEHAAGKKKQKRRGDEDDENDEDDGEGEEDRKSVV